MSLAPERFEAFFREVNEGREPFPWQARLFAQVMRDGKWPEALDLPTGSGKTSVLDIALFHLACDRERKAALRIAFVVDRRLIVDQAAEHAEHIRALLKNPAAGTVCAEVAAALRRFSDRPLHVARLRGGMPMETFWARTPSQPTILLSTVDQVGSRLLFRGYGVSRSMWPVHAGLLGEDCLIFLDEAHLSEPFRQTAGCVHARVVPLSATQVVKPKQLFALDEDDRAHPVLQERLAAAKPAELLADGDYVEQAWKLSQRGGGAANTVLVVVNRVAEARRIFEALAAKGAEAALFIGRVRDIDRQRNTATYTPRLRSFAQQTGEPLFVVATQCIEAGADFDFDALVSQIAPLDALRQRFGRLNRMGKKTGTRAVIIAAKTDLKPKRPDPVYGDRSAACWNLLSQIPQLDFGIGALEGQLASRAAAGASSERKNAPVLMPPYLDFWTQTNQRPAVEPDVPLFLHGPESGPPDVNLVWRADLGFLEEGDADRLTELLTLVPPRSAESLSVPIYAAQAWLQGKHVVPVADVESGALENDDRSESQPLGQVLRWAGPEDARTGLIWPEEIKPGDTLLVPAHFGGADRWGWNPASNVPVEDVAREAAAPYRERRFLIRLHPALMPDDVWPRVEQALYDYRDEPIRELVDRLCAIAGLPETLHSDLVLLQNFLLSKPKQRPRLEEPYQSRGAILVLRPGLPSAAQEDNAPPEGDDDASLRSASHSLAGHTADVVSQTCGFATSLELPATLAGDLRIAAELHDLGKGDRRFQTYLHGHPASGGEVLAKSQRSRLSPTGEQQLWRSSGLPQHWRHEALSVRLAREHPRLQDASDPGLVLWLIGSHHGHGRPFFPHADPLDDQARHLLAPSGELQALAAGAGPQRLDFDWQGFDWPGLFAHLQHTYGPWRLAYYEAIFRLADHRASEEAEN